MNLFQKLKSGIMASGVVLIIAGFILLFFPEATTKTIAYMAAAIFLLMGLTQIIGYLRSNPADGRYSGGIVVGVFFVLVAAFIFFRAEAVISIIPIILGIIILLSGIVKFQQAIDLARMKVSRWSTVLATALLNVILGAVVILNPFSTVTTLLQLVGIGLIYSGLSDIIATLYVSHQMKDHI